MSLVPKQKLIHTMFAPFPATALYHACLHSSGPRQLPARERESSTPPTPSPARKQPRNQRVDAEWDQGLAEDSSGREEDMLPLTARARGVEPVLPEEMQEKPPEVKSKIQRPRSVRLAEITHPDVLRAAWARVQENGTTAHRGRERLKCTAQEELGSVMRVCHLRILRAHGGDVFGVREAMREDRSRMHASSKTQTSTLQADLWNAAVTGEKPLTRREKVQLADEKALLPFVHGLASTQVDAAWAEKSTELITDLEANKTARKYSFRHFMIGNEAVCNSCYRLWYGFTSNTKEAIWLKSVWNRNHKEAITILHGNKTSPEHDRTISGVADSQRSLQWTAWLKRHARSHGEMMPMATSCSVQTGMNVEYRLPPGTKGMVHNEYVAEMNASIQDQGWKPLSYQRAILIWGSSSTLACIKISRVKGDFVMYDARVRARGCCGDSFWFHF